MDDKEYKGRFNFDSSDIFTPTSEDDISSKLSPSEMPDKDRSKFVVHIDEDTADSFDYDFEAFSSASERIAEQKRKEALYKKIDEIEREVRPQVNRPKPAQSRPTGYDPLSAHGTDTAKKKPVQNGNGYATVSRSNNIKKPAQAPAPTQNQSEVPPTEKRQVRMRTTSAKSRLATLVLFIAVVAVLTLSFTVMSMSAIGDILAINRSEEFVRVEIPADPSMGDVIDALHDAGLIKQKFLCTLFAKYRHFDGYTDSKGEYHKTTYLAGIYDLEPKQGLEGMLNTVKESKGNGAETVNVTFPEGWTITQIFERLEKKGVCSASKLYANIEAVAKQYDFYYSIPKSEARYLGVEGYLFPDTYEFYKNENAVSVLKKLFDNSDKKWKKKYESKAKKLGYTRDEILIIASIIQKEAANESQMADVSSVIHNRLKSSTFPNLQCDSTSDYVTNHVKPKVDSSHAQIYADSYNTYKIEGLPPGPICNPGLDAIKAALNPNDTDYYFFCHNNKGKIYLSKTYDQFQRDSLQVINDNNGG